MADIKNFGIKGIAADVQMGKSGGRLKYDSSNNRFDLTQSDGSTLEDLRLGTVTSGAWNGTAISTTYGGTGQDFSSSSGIIKVSSGTMSAGSIDLTADVTGTLPVANGGTGATSAGDARTALGLGNLALQASNSVDIDGGAIDGTAIGANSASTIIGTTIQATSGFTGDLTGTAQDATILETARTISATGDITWTSGDFDGSENVSGAATLATVNSNVGTFGSTTAIPVVTVNAKGLVTAVTTASVSSALTIGADSGSDDVVTVGTDTLNFVGTSNEIETTVSNNQIQIGLPNDVTIGNNLSVTGSFLSDDITAATVTINGNLTVTGTQTTTDSTVVTVADPLFQVGSDTNDNLDRGITFLHNDGSAKTGFFGMDEGTGVFTYIQDATDTDSVITGSAGDVKFGAVEGTSFSDGTISGITFVDEDNMASDSATKVPTQQSVKAYVDAQITAQDLDFAGDSGGDLAIDLDSEKLSILGGTGLSTAGSGNSLTVSLDDTAVTPASYGSTTTIPVLTIDQQGRITAASEASISTSWTVSDGSTTSTIDAGDTLVVTGGTNLTSTVSGDQVTVDLDATLTGLTSVTSATLTDGNGATITAGDFSGVDVTASGIVSFGTLTDSGESIAITKFVDEADGIGSNDNDTTIPTSAAVVDYVANNAGDGLLLRASFTANSSDATFNIGTVPNVSGRTYYASRVILNVSTEVSGGSVAGMLVKDNAGSGNTLAAATENDVAVGTYVIDIDYADALTKNAAIQVAFVQANGTTSATPTGGVVNAQVEYKFV